MKSKWLTTGGDLLWYNSERKLVEYGLDTEGNWFKEDWKIDVDEACEVDDNLALSTLKMEAERRGFREKAGFICPVSGDKKIAYGRIRIHSDKESNIAKLAWGLGNGLIMHGGDWAEVIEVDEDEAESLMRKTSGMEFLLRIEINESKQEIELSGTMPAIITGLVLGAETDPKLKLALYIANKYLNRR